MVVAYVLLIVKPGEEANVGEKLKGMKGIKDVSVVYGEYDIMHDGVADQRIKWCI